MAAGTIFSRVSGLIRGILLAAVLGASLHAELFQIANTIPNMLYIMLAGGVFNAVLVPQLVRTAREDVDGGEAYINRVMTLSFFVLGVATVLLIVFAPVLMDQIYLADAYQTEELAKQRDSVISLARYCLPQVFFYGMFTLAGQVLNARGRFGPMMWAPIVNNIIAITVLVGYLAVYGIATGAELRGPYTERQEVFLGLGSTLGIAAQLLVLIPYLRAAGVKFRPRFDFAHPSIKHTLSLGLWTFGFVLVNQIALAVVVNLASAGPAEAPDGTGYTIYSTTFALLMLPHSVITVSLTTAILPLLSQFASEGKIAELLSTLYATLRSALVIVLPAAALLPLLAPEIARSIWGGRGLSTARRIVCSGSCVLGSSAPVLHCALSVTPRLLRVGAYPNSFSGPGCHRCYQYHRCPGLDSTGFTEALRSSTYLRLRTLISGG
jgi:putative peptidoglycan lipid II flippase